MLFRHAPFVSDNRFGLRRRSCSLKKMEMYRVVKNYEKTLIPTTDEAEKILLDAIGFNNG
jgi:hypothetical protein